MSFNFSPHQTAKNTAKTPIITPPSQTHQDHKQNAHNTKKNGTPNTTKQTTRPHRNTTPETPAYQKITVFKNDKKLYEAALDRTKKQSFLKIKKPSPDLRRCAKKTPYLKTTTPTEAKENYEEIVNKKLKL